MNIIQEYNTATEALEALLSRAVKERASDIHIDPTSRHVRVRLRIDGRMVDVCILHRRIHEELISKVKILSGMRIDIHSVPQDGRWKTSIGIDEYSIRASCVPTYHGENVVLRLLLNAPHETPSFASLGFMPGHVATIDRVLRKKNGLIIVTGPTGSGKTTTLHACLLQKTREPLSIITLEDPVEYEIQGARQVHIHHEHGVTFAHGLRSALRQDPDVIMVGEIRDTETACVAIHTALTGHLVLSTLHTNSAIESIPRLIDMGIDPHLVASTLSLVIAQRLVRTLCDTCDGEGCDTCKQSGFFGRSVIVEVYEPDDEMKVLITNKRPLSEYIGHARSHGFETMHDDGMEKVLWGVTTKSEVIDALYR